MKQFRILWSVLLSALLAPAVAAADSWSAAASMADARSFATATLLPDWKVLVTGGQGPGPLNSAELYDPATNSWSVAASMASLREIHTATLLSNGKVLVAGGGEPVLNGAELYDPATNTWNAAASMATSRWCHTATLLTNGKVLVAGGEDAGAWWPDSFISSAELYDPATDTWSAAASMAYRRSFATATLLTDGKVLVVGGYGIVGVEGGYYWSVLNSAELYDPATDTWSGAGSMATARFTHTATLLPNGKVLVAGGEDSSTNVFNSAELYDPATNSWSAAASMAIARSYHTSTLLIINGKVLVAGGDGGALNTAELYDPATDTWSAAAAMATPHYTHTATLLASGKVVVAGGYNFDTGFLNSVELYEPDIPTPTPTSTDTPTDTPTHTPTDTPTNTPTGTPAWTQTLLPTATPTGTPANTSTNTPTNTSTSTNTPTTIDTATVTPTLPLHDSVVLPLRPKTYTILPGQTSITKELHVIVGNADILPVPEYAGHTVQLNVSSADCPAEMIGTPDFGKAALGPSNVVNVAGGKRKTAKVPLVIASASFVTFNGKAPTRCTLTFTATVGGSNDPTPANAVATIEINIKDKNDPQATARHESLIKSIAALKVTLARNITTKVKTANPTVINADILPAMETGADAITVFASDGDCPIGTVGVADYDAAHSGAQNTAQVAGGQLKAGKLPLTLNASAFFSPNKKSPARCTAVLSVSGPGGDTDSSNNTTKLVIDVIDKNDF